MKCPPSAVPLAPICRLLVALVALVALVHASDGLAAPLGVPDGSGGSIVAWNDAAGALRLQHVSLASVDEWPAEGVPVTTASAPQGAASLVSDGAGGVIVTWQEARTGALRVYAQRVNSSGQRLWSDAGLSVSPADAFRSHDALADGAGGAFVAWADARAGTPDVYAQHLGNDGAELWTPGGALVAGTAAEENAPWLSSDAAGGVFVCFTTASLVPRAVRVQRMDAAGAPAWSGPVEILSGAGGQQIVPDGAAGAIVLGVSDGGTQFLLQRVAPSGALPWGGAGRVMASFDQVTTWGLFPAIVPDGAGGVVASWFDGTYANGGRFVEAGRFDAAGNAVWGSEPVTLGRVQETGAPPQMVSDAAGGAVVAWSLIVGASMDVFAQRVEGDGSTPWLAGGVPICTAPHYQSPFVIVADGGGGATIAWLDWRYAGGAADVFAQRLTPAGTTRWRDQGAPVFLSRLGQRTPDIVADGASGAVTAWMEVVDGIYQIRAQRVAPSGDPIGPIRVLSGVEAKKSGPMVVSDGAGGALIAWTIETGDAASGTYVQRMDSGSDVVWCPGGVKVSDLTELGNSRWMVADGTGGAFLAFASSTVRVQHLDAAGAPLWGPDGSFASSAPQTSRSTGNHVPTVVADGSGGVFVVWADGRWYDNHCISGCGYAVMAQRLDASGAPLWAIDGIALKSRYQSNSANITPDAASDGDGGLFAAWATGAGSATVYAQHVDGAGTPAWVADGIALSPSLTAGPPQLLATAPGHAVAVWADSRSAAGLDLYAQRVTVPGPGLWTPGGVALCTESGNQSGARLAADGSGGFVAVWTDSRSDAALDVFAQRADATGARLWDPAGVAVSTGIGAQLVPVLAEESDGGAIFAWQDGRTGFAPKIGLKRVGADGTAVWIGEVTDVTPPGDAAPLALAPVSPNPARVGFVLRFRLPDASPARLELLDLAGRRRASEEVGGEAGEREFSFATSRLPAGLYMVRLVHPAGIRSAKVVVLP